MTNYEFLELPIIDKSINTFTSGTTQSYLDMFIEYGYLEKVKPEDLYCYVFQKDKICFDIKVIKKQDRFYLFLLSFGVCFPYD